MSKSKSGRHFLQIPGPTNVPDRVLRAIDQPTIDHRGPDFAAMNRRLLEDLKQVFRCSGPVLVFPGSGSGGWEAALVNTLSAGDRILMVETGHFATLWRNVALRFGLEVDFIPGDWRRGVEPGMIEERLARDRRHATKAVAIVHNETSTGAVSDIAAVRQAIDRAGHPALLMVDAVSSLGSMDYRHDEWGVDVTIAGSQKGLMLPPGLAFTAVGNKALEASARAALPRSYWDWGAAIEANATGSYPYTPATNLLFGLREALTMLAEEGLENVFDRHARLARATRSAVDAWGLEIVCAQAGQRSDTLTSVLMPAGHDADALRELILKRFDMSLGTGLGKLKGKAFRIGHLGYFNELMLAGTLCGVQMGLALAGVPHREEGVRAALAALASTSG